MIETRCSKNYVSFSKQCKNCSCMFCMPKKKKKYPAYVSKYNSNCEKQVGLGILFWLSTVILEAY